MIKNEEYTAALKELLYKMADDQLILGHRNSEWTGIGPFLEEDIAFSSIAQDKIGQAWALYRLLHEIGEDEPDKTGFLRDENKYKCCHLTEFPIGEYDFSLMRNFLFSHSELIRFGMLSESSFEPLSNTAKKFKGEIKYHVMHSDNWVIQLGNGNESSNARMQSVLEKCFNHALGIFEHSEFEDVLINEKIFTGENKLQNCWLETIQPILKQASLKLPPVGEWKPSYGGRKGLHTEYFRPLLNEMSEVLRTDPETEW